MRVSITNNKNSSSFYVIKSVTVDGKRTSKIIERLGNYEEVKIKANGEDPIVQMELFLNGDGIPLAFNINPGNTNEQITLQPLEKQIINDFNNASFVVCTDAGLASNANRKFNDKENRKFITTQSIKKLKDYLKEWMFDKTGLHIPSIPNPIDLSNLDNDEELQEKFKDTVSYKERWINENGLEQKIIVTYSLKYKNYQKNIRNSQIERTQKLINSNPKSISIPRQNYFKKFIEKTNTTKDGIVAEEIYYNLNQEAINNESKYDGYSTVCTNLEDTAEEIIKINKNIWEIEERLRIMKSEFKARPVYLSRDDRIKAHFTTCFLALTIFRYLEKKIKSKYTATEIIEALRNYNLRELKGFGYIPDYELTDIVEDLQNIFNINTSTEINDYKKIQKICKQTK